MKLAISILNINFKNLERSIREIEKAGADSLHMDIMDGQFVDNISFGPDIVKTVSEIASLPLHTHLMINNPERFLDRFLKAGSETVTVHVETLNKGNFNILNKDNIGISLNPDASLEIIYPYLNKIKRVLVMSVNPGFGGQKFMENSLVKISDLAGKKRKLKLKFEISVDGGINSENALKCSQAGADEVVVGAYVTGTPDTIVRIKKLRDIIKNV